MLSTNEISQVLQAVRSSAAINQADGCADLTCEKCLPCRVRLELQGKPPEHHAVTIGSLMSARTREGKIEIIVNDERIQLPVRKAREVYGMLGEAIEAAVTDESIWKLLKGKGLEDDEAGAFLLDLREARQGGKGTVYPS